MDLLDFSDCKLYFEEPLPAEAEKPGEPTVRAFQGQLERDWWISSYSGLAAQGNGHGKGVLANPGFDDEVATEAAVTEAVAELSGEVTVIVVAHRLATIRHSDQVCFMREAHLEASGTFDEVVAAAPDFAQQAALAGLLGDDDHPGPGPHVPSAGGTADVPRSWKELA